MWSERKRRCPEKARNRIELGSNSVDRAAEILIANYGGFALLTGAFLTILLLILYHKCKGLTDPMLIPIALNLAPSLAGYVVICGHSWQAMNAKFYVFMFASFLFFLGFGLTPYRPQKFSISLTGVAQTTLWQVLALFGIFSLGFLSFLMNSNFGVSDPSKRFSAINVPLLHYLNLAIAPAAILLIFVVQRRWLKILAGLLFALSFGLNLTVAHGKGALLVVGNIFLIWSFLRRPLYFRDLVLRLKIGRIPTVWPIVVCASVISIALAIFYNVRSGAGQLLAVRFGLGFDSPIIYTIHSIEYPNGGIFPDFANILELWLKPFVKNILGKSYVFDNISEYLTYRSTGFFAQDYAHSFWQPNNNLIVDLMFFYQPAVVIAVAFFLGLLCGHLNTHLKSVNLNAINLTVFMYFVTMPFNLFIDAQMTIVSIVLSFGFFCVVTFFASIPISIQRSQSMRNSR